MDENVQQKAGGLIMTQFRTNFQESVITGILPKKDSHDGGIIRGIMKYGRFMNYVLVSKQQFLIKCWYDEWYHYVITCNIVFSQVATLQYISLFVMPHQGQNYHFGTNIQL